MAKENVFLASKPRYEVLDAFRGVAAMMVVFFHIFETYAPFIGKQHVNHGYLAVDFFFVLSGFVIGYAYDDRWDRMTTWGFFKRRLTRLHPMVLAGTVVGACLFFFGAGAFPKILENPFWKVALCFVMGLVMIPCGPKLDIRGWEEFNSFNGPNWTLTFEYIGNILYAFIFRHLPKVVLAVLCACCAFFTLDLTIGWDVFGLFPDGPQYTVIGGWSLTSQQIYIGFTRLLYPFLCGLLISRILPGRRTESNPSGSPLQPKYGFLWGALLLIAIFSIPCIGGEPGVPNGIYQAVCIIVLFPFIVLLGAGSKTRTAVGAKVCKFLGEISYPLYITHYPIMYTQMAWVAEHQEASLYMHILMNAGVVVMSVILAWSLYKLYDLPVREWLTEHWLKRAPKAKRAGA